jgi:cation diffusion facilitator CzcD-associated flavoprotein CzcO
MVRPLVEKAQFMSSVPVTNQSTTHTDVLIIGAGISGIGAAYHLQQQCPEKTYTILDTQPAIGGTWTTHTYPGIRSDSDFFTFGYRFKAWTGAPIATAAQILKYLREVIDENDIQRHIHHQHSVLSAEWDSGQQRWSLQVLNKQTNQVQSFSCNFLWMCQGYYRHGKGYTPEWPGMANFEGQIVHPQTWPDDLAYKGKRVVVIGSGATAATLVPAIANDCAHVTMLQRSPTYFRTAANANELADTLRQLDIPQEWTHEIVRRKVLFDQSAFTKRAALEPDVVKRELIENVRSHLGENFDVEKHFSPSYRPWQQRLAFIPDADLFRAVAAGKASVVTDDIDCFTAEGIRLKSGVELPADIIVTATGFHLSSPGEIPFTVDGQLVDFHKTITYRGTMFSGVPNMSWMFGYLRASWTLRVDLLSDYICRMLNHMRDQNLGSVTPTLRPSDATMPLKPWIDKDNFSSGYMMRSLHLMPQQIGVQPWKLETDYFVERDLLPTAALDDGILQFTPKIN